MFISFFMAVDAWLILQLKWLHIWYLRDLIASVFIKVLSVLSCKMIFFLFFRIRRERKKAEIKKVQQHSYQYNYCFVRKRFFNYQSIINVM